jgi:hypothetical protein
MSGRAVGLVIVVTLVVFGGCATTSVEKTPEQIALEKEYNNLEGKKQAIKKKEAAVKKQAKSLFSKATALENGAQLAGKKSMAVVPPGKSLPGTGVKLGPLKLDKKSASFKLSEGRATKRSKGAVHVFKFSSPK